ncbi:MAG: GAF domain-containing protein [Anaerolineae bacterium]|nr:GAF domain-containing protein [Anaerolineae bacterium]
MEPFLAAACVALALAVGWLAVRQHRQRRHIQHLQRKTARLDELAGFGQAILSVQFKLDALCEVVYQQVSQLIDTTNFQLGLFDETDYVIMVWLRNGERLPQQRFPRAAAEGLIGWVRSTGQGLLVGDYEKEWDSLPAKPSYHGSQPARSALFAPLMAGGTPIGVIAVQSNTPYTYAEDDKRLLMVLTNQAAGAIRNAQLFEQAQARNRQLQLVSEVSQQVTSSQPLADLFEQVVSLLQHTFGYYVVNLFTLPVNGDTLQLQASTHHTFRARVPQIQLGVGLVGWAAERASTAMVADVTKDHRYLDDGILKETRAEIVVPLIVERRVMGVLDVQSDQTGAFTNEDVVMLETLASQIALAIQEAESYAAERRQRERLNALTEASRAVVSILNIDDLLDEVVDLATDYFGFDRTHIFLSEGEQLLFQAGSGVHSERWAIEGLSYAIDSPGIIAKCFRTGQPIICSDVRNYPDYIAGSGVEDTRSEMALPIRMNMQTLGVLDIQSTKPGAFSQDDAALAEALSDTMAIALRNAALYAREKRRRILAESLREVSMGLGASLEVDRVLEGILQGLTRVINIRAAVIFLYDDDVDAYRISAVEGDIEDDAPLDTLFPPDTDIESAVVSIFHPHGTDTAGPGDTHLTLPLMLADESIGYLCLDRQGRLTEDDLEMIGAFATQSAMAIANARLYMAQREEAWVSTALLQVAESTARADTLDEVLQTVTRITPLLVGVEWCGILLAESGGFRVVEIEGIPPNLAPHYIGRVLRPEDWPPLQTLAETRRLVLLSEQDVPTLPEDAQGQPVRIAQGVMLPLYAKGEIVGAMLIGQPDGEDLLSRRKLEMVGGIANQAALAIESAQLSAAQQEEAWVTTALLQVAEAVNAQVDIRSTLETIVRLTPLLVGVRHCVVLRWDADTEVFCDGVSFGFPQQTEEALAGLALSPGDDPYIHALALGGAPLTAGTESPHAIPQPLAQHIDVARLLGLPLTAQGKLAGLMLVDDPDQPGVDDRRRLNILTGIAYQTAIAIETSRLQHVAAERQHLEHELEVAQGIQSSFLPRHAPVEPGWDVAAYYRAARMVGGDFYDFLQLPNGKWGLVVADVADKGMPAALYMALSRTLLRAVARNRDNPARTLMRVNKLLLEDTHSDLFVTMWYAIWDPTEGSFFYSSAGHNPPLLMRGSGQVTSQLKLKGIALGVLPEITLQTGRVHLHPGDILIMYTDGVTEAQNTTGSQFGVDGLENATALNNTADASTIIRGIVDALDRHTEDEPQFDDLTLVVIRRADA